MHIYYTETAVFYILSREVDLWFSIVWATRMEPREMTFYRWIPKLLKFKPTPAMKLWFSQESGPILPLYICLEKTMGGDVDWVSYGFPEKICWSRTWLFTPNWYTPVPLECSNRRRPMSGQKAVDGVQPARHKEGQRLTLLRKSGVGSL